MIFLRRWMASMCWAAVHPLSSNSSKSVTLFRNDFLTGSRELTATRIASTSNSMGKVASIPNTGENGVACVVTLKVVVYAQSAAVNLTSQSLFESKTVF